MKILAIDTSTSVLGVSLLDDKKIYGEVIINLKTNHSIRLMPTIDHLFTEVNWSPQQIDLIAVAKGPGSYTGVRIGVTTAKAFAWALNIPVVGISSLEAMAFAHQNFTGPIVPVIDARRGQAYTAVYGNQNAEWGNIESDTIILMSDWLAKINQLSEKILFIGDDVTIHQDLIIDKLGEKAQFSFPTFNIPRSSVIGLLALKKYLKGHIENLFDFGPSYLQLAEAEAKWLENQNICIKE